jgi:gliding motility-associated-like protein
VDLIAQNWNWAVAAGGSLGVQEGMDVATDHSGNVYCTGYFGADSMSFGSNQLVNADPSFNDVFVVKYDNSGNAIWARNGIGQSEGSGIAADDSGNVYVTGIFRDSSITFGSFVLTNSTPLSCDIFLVKYNSLGNVVWAVQSAGNMCDVATSITVDHSQNIIITGLLASSSVSFGSFTLGNSGSGGIFIVKYDPNGNVIWAEQTNGNASDAAYAIASDTADNLYIGGGFTSSTITLGANSMATSPAGSQNTFLAKLDPAGNCIWLRSSGNGSILQCINGLTIDQNMNVIVGGTYIGPSISFGAVTLNNSSSNTQDVFLVKYDANGNVIWGDSFGGAQSENGYSVAVDPLGNVYFSGGYYSSIMYFGNDTVSIPPGAIDPSFIVKTDPYGNLRCVTALSSGGDDQNSIAADDAGFIYTDGDFFNTDPFIVGDDTLHLNSQFENFYLAKYNCGCTNLETSSSVTICSNTGLSISPIIQGTSYQWSTGATTSSIFVSPTVPTTYSVVTTSLSCTDSSTISVDIDSSYIIGTSFINVDCNGFPNGSAAVIAGTTTPPLQYQWSPTGGVNSSATGFAAGTYTCVVTDSLGCIASASFTITEPPPIVVSTSSTSVVCTTLGTATASASGGVGTLSYAWTPGGQSTSGISGLLPGGYSVFVTDSNGCFTNQFVTVQENDSVIDAFVSVTSSQCSVANGSASVIAAGGSLPYTYNWSSPGGSATSINGLSAGTYSVVITDANGCSTTGIANITNPPGPNVFITGDTTIFPGGSATLFASGGNSYSWSPSTGLSCTNCQYTSAQPDVTTMYCVTVTDTNGCSSQACETVFVRDECDIYVPNAFSPNNDGTNDCIFVHSNCLSSMTFMIYDRWGTRMFVTTDPSVCWDGTYKGHELESAVFFYSLDATFKSGRETHLAGTISLVK